MKYTYTKPSQVRRAFWVGFPQGYRRGRKHNEYNATIRSEFSAFVDMLHRDGHISEKLAYNVKADAANPRYDD